MLLKYVSGFIFLSAYKIGICNVRRSSLLCSRYQSRRKAVVSLQLSSLLYAITWQASQWSTKGILTLSYNWISQIELYLHVDNYCIQSDNIRWNHCVRVERWSFRFNWYDMYKWLGKWQRKLILDIISSNWRQQC